MATLTVLGSGSKGNAMVIECDGALLLLDAGFSLKELERRMEGGGLNPSATVAIAITHEHGDHSAGATSFARRHNVPLLTSYGTWRAISRGGEPCEFRALATQNEESVGPFLICSCATSHDANEPIALGIRTRSGISFGVAYDLGRPTQAVRWFLRERHCLVLEANHDETLLRSSGYPAVVQQRIAGPGGHLSNHDAARLLAEVHHEELEWVVLAHMSQRSNSHDVARATISGALSEVGYKGELVLALQDGPMPSLTVRGPAQAVLF